jgi:hypothetical protein
MSWLRPALPVYWSNSPVPVETVVTPPAVLGIAAVADPLEGREILL